MDKELYLYAAKSIGKLHHQIQSRLDSELTPQENTALHIAAKFGQTKRVEEIHNLCPSLLRRPNSKDDTALHLAARNGFPDIVSFLIDQAKQRTLPQEDIGVAETEESLIRMTNKKKNTALHEAVRNHFLFDGQKETQYLEVVKLLTQADPEFQYFANDSSETPLYIAAEEGLHRFVSRLLEVCPSCAYHGPVGRTALHAAVYGGHLDMSRELLEKKPDLIREVDDDGWSPLHFAVFCGSHDMVKLLLESDRSVAYLPNKEGISPIHIAAEKAKDPLIFRELIKHCPDCHELVDNKGWNALHFVTMNRSFRLPYVILSQDILQSMANEVDNDGNTPLHLAAKHMDNNTTNAILNYRTADSLAMNNDHLTALDIIQKEGDPVLITGWVDFLSKWKKMKAVRRRVREVRHKEEVESMAEIDEDKNKSGPNKQQGSNESIDLLVATLIATVTFAAGFTMPGGFNSSNPDVGAAVLANNAAFKAFVISNTAAMVFAVTAVFLHFWGTLFKGFPLVKMFPKLGARLIVLAASSMVTAFVTGTYAVLPTSQGLAAAVCVIGSTFYLFLALCLLVPCTVPFVMGFVEGFNEGVVVEEWNNIQEDRENIEFKIDIEENKGR